MVRRCVVALSLLVVLPTTWARAEDDKFSATPGPLIELTMQPRVLPQGAPAEFAGIATQLPGGPSLVLQVKLPGGQTKRYDVKVRGDHTFRFSFDQTVVPGHYLSTWSSTDGKTAIDAKFEVASPAGFAQAVAAAYDRSQTAIDGGLRVVRERVTALPPSPPRQDLLARLDSLERGLAAHRSLRARVVDLVNAATTVAPIRPAETAAFVQALADWSRRLDGSSTEARQWIDRTRAMPSTCDTIDTAQEGLALVSTAFNVGTVSLAAILKNLWVDKVMPARLDQLPLPDSQKLTLTEASKIGIAALDGVDAALASLGGVFGDLAQYATKQLFAAYCELLEGPVRGEFEVTMRTGGKVWWRHRLQLVGKLKLWHEKSQPATPDGHALRGKLEGNVTTVEFDEDIFLIERPPAANMSIKRLRFTPWVLPFDSSNDIYGLGAARAAIPGTFSIRYAGRLKPATLQLTQQEVMVDFTRVFANRSVVIATAPGVPVPMLKVFRFPIQKAAFILGRASKQDPLLPVTVDTTPGSGKVSAKTELVRDETLADGSTVHWKISIEVASKK
ncbi:MAG: hypothetical protein SFX73_14945 [Kofleriaceae bacterium]|nr:hypothetical protein [Kofleriaceae bacterium]